MKHTFLLLFILVLQQVNSQQVTVSALKMNVLYTSIDNPIEVAAEKVPCNRIVVEISDGASCTPIEGQQCAYKVNVSKPGKVSLTIKEKRKNGQLKLLAEKVFRVKRLPDPTVYLSPSYNPHYGSIKMPTGLLVLLENFDFDEPFTVKHFDVLSCPNGEFKIIRNDGPLFNKEVQKLIQEAKRGDVLLFDNIVVISADGMPRKLAPILKTIDGFISKECYPQIPLYNVPEMNRIDTNAEQQGVWRHTLNCSCQCIDEAIGEYEDGIRKGWWTYNKLFEKRTQLIRKEYYNEDTAIQISYANDSVVVKECTYLNGMLNGKYIERYENGNLKLEGQYVLDTVTLDSVLQINPITLEEELVIEPVFDQCKNGEWLYYNSNGKAEMVEVYSKNKLIRSSKL
ncbi:MAG: GldM family protein [Chitinophagales bacterium]